jgi:hypothetical protein
LGFHSHQLKPTRYSAFSHTPLSFLAICQDDPAFPMHFPWFGTADYWRGQCDTLREQMGLMA